MSNSLILAALACASFSGLAAAQAPADASAPARAPLFEPVRSFDSTGTRSRGAALNADATLVFSADEDGTIRKIRADNGAIVTSFRIANARANALRLSADGKRLIVGSTDSYAHVFDAATGTEISKRKLPGDVRSVWISPDGTTALAAGGAVVCYWSPADTSETFLSTFKVHTGTVFSVAATPDGKRAVSGGSDKIVCTWEPASGRLLNTFRGHTSDVTAVSIDATGTRVASGDAGMVVCYWSPDDPTTVKKLDGVGEPIVALDLSGDGRRLVVAGTYRVLALDPITTKAIAELAPTRYRNFGAVLQPDMHRILVGRDADVDSTPDKRGTVKVFEIP